MKVGWKIIIERNYGNRKKKGWKEETAWGVAVVTVRQLVIVAMRLVKKGNAVPLDWIEEWRGSVAKRVLVHARSRSG